MTTTTTAPRWATTTTTHEEGTPDEWTLYSADVSTLACGITAESTTPEPIAIGLEQVTDVDPASGENTGERVRVEMETDCFRTRFLTPAEARTFARALTDAAAMIDTADLLDGAR